MAHDVFISHSAKDKPAADAVCAVLESEGIRCWIAPRDIVPGASWSGSIVTAIKGARVMVLIFSRHANESSPIKLEVERAVNKGVTIIPMRIEDVMPTEELELFLGAPHWLDAISPPLERHARYLAQVIRKILGEPVIQGSPSDGAKNAAQGEPKAARGVGLHKKTRRNRVLSAVVMALICIGIGYSYLSSRAKHAEQNAPTPTLDTASVAAFLTKFRAESGLTMVAIAPGVFTMGDDRSSYDSAHRVTISRPFFLGATDVTQALWRQVMVTSPSHFKGDTLPVEQVSWDDAMAFCKRLTEAEREARRLPTGWAFTLPTEAQWEYACQAATTGAYAGDLDAMAWYSKNSGARTHPVGTKQPNVWGLYDMYGNVWEMCADWYGSYPAGAVTDPTGPPWGSNRVARGGSWRDFADACGSAARGAGPSGDRDDKTGFRLALSSVQ